MVRLKLTLKTCVLLTGLVFLLVLPLIASALEEQFYIGMFSRILIYALAAVSLDLILGYGGMVSFGHAAFFGTGAYVVGILAFHGVENSALLHWPLTLLGTENVLLSWPVAVLVSAVLAAVIGAISLRTSGVYFIMITLAFAQMMYFFFISLEKYGGDDGLSLLQRNSVGGIDLGDDTNFYYLCLALLIGFLFLCHRLVNSRFGMVIQGCKENERRMGALGFPTYRYKLLCFVIAGAGAGLSGALMANLAEFVSPSLMHWRISGEILVMVILGGMGTLFGPVFGAAGLLLLEEFLSIYTEHWMLFLGPAMILVVLFARRGLYGSFVEKREKNG
ncbi:MAG: branched-chain amino acid ABC transporter permease [Deltaproteobacteria bacterium]|nr:MAG: branched-chain amino acid ABC transporter permease [Deltaproteobacteria bacterium]